MNRIGAIVIALTLCGALAGCGYHMGSLMPDGVRTVHIPIVGNRTDWKEPWKSDNIPPAATVNAPRPSRVMELELTESLREEVVRRTPLRLAARKRADSVLQAEIVRVKADTLLRDTEDELLAQRVTIEVAFTWTDRRSGRVLVRRRVVSRPTEFNRDLGENFTTAARRSCAYLAEQIVEAMEQDF